MGAFGFNSTLFFVTGLVRIFTSSAFFKFLSICLDFQSNSYPLRSACGGSNLSQRTGTVGEAVCLNAELLKHREVEIRQTNFLERHLLFPAGVAVEASDGLIVLVALAVLEKLTVLKTHVLSSRQNQQIVARKMESTGSGAKRHQRVVQHEAVSS